MPLANCPRCKKMYNKMAPGVCPDCSSDEEKDYEKIRELVAKRPNMSVEETAEKAGVATAVVHRMMERGFITKVSENDPVFCGKCGKPAISHSKRLCQECLNKLNLEVTEARRALQAEAPAKRNKLPPGMYSRRDRS